MNLDVGPDTDELYNSLKRLSNSTAMSTVRLRKFNPKPIPFKDEPPKQLTFTLSQVYFTNGRPSRDNELKSEVDEVVGQSRDLFKKGIRVIGTSIENFVISDNISIDIDPESTRLPMMCKLMIIVEGACVERGQRVLVRDAGVQIGDPLDSNISHENSNEISKPTLGADCSFQNGDNEATHSSSGHIKLETVSKSNKSGNQLDLDENRQNNESTDQQKLKIKIVSTDNNSSGNRDKLGDGAGNMGQLNNGGAISIEKISNDGGGSFGRHQGIWKHEDGHRGSIGGISEKIYQRELFQSSSSRHKSTESLNHFSTSSSSSSRHANRPGPIKNIRLLDRNTCGGSLSNLTNDFVNFHAAPSPSGYFSQRHADRTSLFAESYLGLDEYLSTPYYQYQCKNRAKKDFSNSTFEDMIEMGIKIPIRVEPGHVTHRNEKRILITDEKPFVQSSTVRTFASNMRRYLTERLSRFEAEVTFFRLNNQDLMPQFRITSPLHARHFDLDGFHSMPSSYAYEYHHRHRRERFGNWSSGYPFDSMVTYDEKTEPSVTNLMYVKVIDGCLNI